MLDATTAIATVVRPSEKVQLVIDTSPGPGGRSSLASGQTRGSSLQSTRRVIAIITREDDGKEHGGFVPSIIVRLSHPDRAANWQVVYLQMDARAPSFTGASDNNCHDL